MRFLPWLLVVLIVTIGGCYEDENTDSTPLTSAATDAGTSSPPVSTKKIRLTGIVAIGENFNGTVYGINAYGQTAFAPLNSDSVYFLDLAAGTPYLVKAIGSGDDTGQILYSYLDTSDLSATLNLTPLTTAAVQLATGRTIDELNVIFANWNGRQVTSDTVKYAQKTIEQKLSLLFAQVGLDPAHVNIFTTPFEKDDPALGWLMKRIIGTQYANGAVTLIAENAYPLLYPFDLDGNSLSFWSGSITSSNTPINSTGPTIPTPSTSTGTEINTYDQCPVGMTRTGAICGDGSPSSSTGSGTCSGHDGVSAWTCG